MTAAASTLTTYDLNSHAGTTLAALEKAKNWEAWRGAVVLLSSMDANEAAEKAGTEPGYVEIGRDECESDYVGLASDCERTAKFLARWIDRHLGGAKDHGGGTRPSDVRKLSDGRFLATYHIYPGAF